MEERINEEGTQLIDLTPVDTALEAIARLLPAGAPIIRSRSAADTALCISTIVGYVVTLTLAFFLHKQVNAVQESFNKCTSGVPCLFRCDKTDKEPEPENSANLIEIIPLPPCRTPDNQTNRNDQIVNNPKPCIPTPSQVSNLFIPKLPHTRIQSVMEMLFVSCVCLFSLPLVPVPADVPSGTSPSQRGMCSASCA